MRCKQPICAEIAQYQDDQMGNQGLEESYYPLALPDKAVTSVRRRYPVRHEGPNLGRKL